jgi:CPA1 family monovalent cation:H+ antiporter
MHGILPFLLAMIAAIVLLEMLATKLRVAYPIVLVVAGLLISFIPGLPTIKVNPELIFFIVLPPLLSEAAWNISFKEMKKWYRIIGSFAFLVVLFTALAVAVVANQYIPGFSIALGFLLGGIVSPPDAVSTSAITKFVKIPKSTSTILEGESLLNDASSLIIFRFALVAVGTGQFIWHEAALSFVWMIVGGAGAGLVLAWFFVKMHRILPTDASSDIAFTIIEPYLMYWVGEEIHSSGVLAVVAGGLYMSNRNLIFLNSASRIMGYNVWEAFIFILNGIVFLIIGLDLPEIVEGIRSEGIPLRTAIGYGVLVTLVLILTRMISAYMAMLATMIFRRSVLPGGRSRKRQLLIPLLLGWTGMRGVVSLAAALAIPVTLANGQNFPHRNLILFITFIVILLTLLVQGLTLPYFINRSKLFEAVSFNMEPEDVAAEKIRKRLKEHTHHFLKTKFDGEWNGNPHAQKLLQHWEEKIKTPDEDWRSEKTKKMYFEMLDSQRGFLIQENQDPSLNEEVVRHQLYLIDLEEERMKLL